MSSTDLMTLAGQTNPSRLRTGRSTVLPVLTLLVVVAGWEAGCRWSKVPAWLLPAPSAIVEAAARVPLTTWADNIFATMRVVVLGFLAALAVSLPLAVLITRSIVARQCLYPILVVIQSTPVVAVAPILVVTLGAGDAPRIVITAMISFFPLVVGIATGLGQTPPALIELSRSLGAPVRNEYLHIRLPCAIPYVFSSVRVAITLSVIGAVVGEFVAAEKGIGYFIRASTAFFKVPQAFAALLVLIGMSLTLFYGVGFIQKLLFPRSLASEARDAARP